ncbi:MAG TPA: Smr/MutS family protein [Polyangiaceae bacterium]|jgi:DNA-nicking Smr family endonuclease|nr:MAG: putative DNA endonuclease SmrA [Deltaproteobacteria bacterium ADurb.Bin207]HNS95768.1 Smr/MutS family protein [Polyangiaceae bacterium]HNZ22940.1 Smr/MutS family protein [Polyangiaceae bacterium]HOD21229.1 Smr/MutS family protein [Polyangiaceae bacterium]HOE49874.1 Smr/MutS family protein [Polyangiaceae bacterium]
MGAKNKRKKKSEAKPSAKVEPPFFRPFSGLSSGGPRSEIEPTAPVQAAKKSQRVMPSPEPEDVMTFERFMAGVQPLDATKASRVSKTQTDVESSFAKRAQSFAKERELADQQALRQLHALVQDGSRFEVIDDGRRVEGRRRGTDGGMIRRMREGSLPVDASLDLGDVAAQQARSSLENFVRERRIRGDTVVIIHFGRSGHSVLRGEIAAWLSEGDAAKHVAAFLSAPPEWGGENALCVLLANGAESHRGMR